MFKIDRRLLLNSLKVFDIGVMILAFVLGALFVFRQTRTIPTRELFSMRITVRNFIGFSFLVLLWHITLTLSRLYMSHRLSGWKSEMADVLRAVTVGTAALTFGAWLLNVRLLTLSFVALFWLASAAAISLSRILLRSVLAFVRTRGRNLRNVVVVGTNNRAVSFARMLMSRRELGYHLSGFVDQNWLGMDRFQSTGFRIVSDIDGFPQYLRQSVVDEVVLALPFRSMHDHASRVASACEEQGVIVRVLPDVLDLKMVFFATDEVEGQGLLTNSLERADMWPRFLKRVLDVIVSSIALLILSPLFVLIATWVKLNSSGPVFFIQQRVGLHKRLFNFYKFRTMAADAEKRFAEVQHLNEVSGPVFKLANDPRLARGGKFLRKCSLDELPQLLNVFFGDMSLVGPRPLPIRDCEGFDADWQRRRFSVRPGMTCLWQVAGRSAIPFYRWMELDLQYIEKWSLWLDMKILVRTIPAVLKGSGAV